MKGLKRILITNILLLLCATITIAQQPVSDFKIKTSESSFMDFKQKEFLVIAHRGASAYYPENTMAAFKAAVEMKADMIELDVMMSKDNIPVVFHDDVLEYKTNGKGSVADYTLSELKELDAGSWFDEKFKEERIPTLREVLDYARNKIPVNIEIKTEAVTENKEGGIVERVLKLIDELGMADQVIVSSFDYRVIERLKAAESKIMIAMLYERQQSYGRNPVTLVKEYKADAFNFSSNELAGNWIAQLNDAKIPFFIYTINKEDLMESVIRSGARGIFTDKPDVLYRIADEVLRKKWR